MGANRSRREDDISTKPKTGLSRTFILYTLGSFAVLSLIFIGGLTQYLWQREMGRAITTTETLFQASKEPLERAVWSINKASADQIVAGLLSLEVVDQVWVETPDTGTYGFPADEAVNDIISYDLLSPIQYSAGGQIGTVHFIIDRAEITEQVTSVVVSTVISIVFYLLFLAIILQLIFDRLIGFPLSKIVEYLNIPGLIETPPNIELLPGRQDELGVLANSLQTMVMKRHADLKQIQAYQQNLEDLVDQRTEQLKQVQDELIQADNLAALGSLVAGVSHELNTPLGNGLMAATTISEACVILKRDLSHEALTRELLEEQLDRVTECSTVIEKTLARARELVQNFRQVAVDRQSEKRREFNIDHIIRETIATIQPSMRATPFSVKLDLSADVNVVSYPGAISQIVTNLVENAVKHGYEGQDAGEVTVSSRKNHDGAIIIECNDDGCGISDGNLKRLFEPFFTTKFGKGGSGLGMAIVYRLVTEVIGGQIHVKSTVGEGTTITIVIPASLRSIQSAA
ncbi:periplasmic sensor Signal transduction histidine kinase [Roseibium sp. TrichSKD4]|uniref:sensor histidine kinase n=1 Tax=Roseibium sp. TrichSKD4 TaxID=744980 RepID=UPI0001E56743|nr:HAMP domain-containing sensor histidine kinase [Roseibium sp. TrichSKD4]EFO33666.1 periplasmic sensor Signal transduction histidine kinase [Roseibium sp. TrichSKD4]